MILLENFQLAIALFNDADNPIIHNATIITYVTVMKYIVVKLLQIVLLSYKFKNDPLSM